MAARAGGARRTAWLAGLLFLLVVGPWVKELTVQPASRLALTAAVVDRGTIRVDHYAGIVGIDRVERDGHLYSDKAPGQPFLAVPAYALARLAGAEPAEVPRGNGNLTLWWVTLWSAAVPGALVVVAMTRLCEPAGERTAVGAALAIAFGTLLLPFSAELYGHVLATLLGLLSWMLVRHADATARLVVAGAVAGSAVLVEYQMVLVAVVVVALAAWRGGVRAAGLAALGGVPPALLLLAYQAAAFGSPLRTSYGEKPVHDEGGATIVGIPDPLQALEVLFGRRGLLVFAPVVLVALLGLLRLVRGPRAPVRRDAVVATAVFVGFLLVQAGWPNPWGGEMPGPRYVIPALPLLVVGLAASWDRLGALGRAAIAWSVVAMSFPLVTLHLVPDGGTTVVQHLRNIDDFGVSPTIWTMLLGPAGWAVHGATAAAAAWWLHTRLPAAVRRSPASAGGRPSPTPSSPDRR